MSQASPICEQVLNAVRAAGELIIQGRDGSKHVERKGRIDLVTETDRQVEEFLKEELAAILPEASFLAEESAADAGLSDPCWIIDPLDGTTNYAHGLPVMATSVALWRGGDMEVGVVGIPVLDEYFHAERGAGAFLNGEPIAVTGVADPLEALVATGFPYAIRENVDEVLDNMRRVLVTCQGLRRMGAAAVDLAYVAAGRFDAFYEPLLHPWDTAAGLLLVQEAGGRVTTFEGGSYDIFQKTIVASNGHLHQVMMDLLSG